MGLDVTLLQVRTVHALGLGLHNAIVQIEITDPSRSASRGTCCRIHIGEIVIPSVHLNLMYVFNFSYNYLTIIRIGPLPLGILLLHLAALGSSTGAYLIL